jgi:hypothetical protein
MRISRIVGLTADVLATLFTAAAIGAPAALAHPVQDRFGSSATPQTPSPLARTASTSSGAVTPAANCPASDPICFTDPGTGTGTGTNSSGAVTPAASCPTSGSICFYDSRNFHDLLGWATPRSCSGTYVLPDPSGNKIESVRNRTGCQIFLLYYCGRSLCHNEWMRPYSEDGTIHPLKAIDAIKLA